MKKIIRIVWLVLLFIPVAKAENLLLKANHPTRYVVKQGDTLWGISRHFLHNPWAWPSLWRANPAIADPNKIYPGDVLALHRLNGKTVLEIERRGQASTISHKTSAILSIPMAAIKPFVSGDRVIEPEAYGKLPYIVSQAGEHLVTGAGDEIYVRGITTPAISSYGVFRQGSGYADPVTGEILGYVATYIGKAQLKKAGETATLVLTGTAREVLVGDRLLPGVDQASDLSFAPHPPAVPVKGLIMAIPEALNQGGEYQIAFINKGSQDGIEAGNILALYHNGKFITDSQKSGTAGMVQLPDTRIGEVMVLRVYKRLSLVLILEVSEAVRIGDIVSNPA